VDTNLKFVTIPLQSVGFREVSRLNSFKNFKNQTTGCVDIAYCLATLYI